MKSGQCASTWAFPPDGLFSLILLSCSFGLCKQQLRNLTKNKLHTPAVKQTFKCVNIHVFLDRFLFFNYNLKHEIRQICFVNPVEINKSQYWICSHCNLIKHSIVYMATRRITVSFAMFPGTCKSPYSACLVLFIDLKHWCDLNGISMFVPLLVILL